MTGPGALASSAGLARVEFQEAGPGDAPAFAWDEPARRRFLAALTDALSWAPIDLDELPEPRKIVVTSGRRACAAGSAGAPRIAGGGQSPAIELAGGDSCVKTMGWSAATVEFAVAGAFLQEIGPQEFRAAVLHELAGLGPDQGSAPALALALPRDPPRKHGHGERGDREDQRGARRARP